MTNLGHALFGQGELDKAGDAYRQGLTLRRELGELNMAMEPLSGLARVALAQEDLSQAQVHVEEVLSHLESGTLEGTYEPFRVYLTCHQVLSAMQDARAGGIIVSANRLLQERAAKIEDEETRRSFLENVAEHRQIQDIAAPHTPK